MTNDDGGVHPAATPPPPGYSPPSWPYQGYPPYSPYQGNPAYPGYPPPVGPPPALKPGVIPLRPLSLSDIFNAAFAYIRVNPRATLGLTTIVVVITQIIVLILVTGVPLALYGQTDVSRVDETTSAGALIGTFLSVMAVGLTSVMSGVVLSGMLTVVMGRAVFGANITIRETWERVRGRLLPLLGLMVLEALGAVLLFGATVAIVAVAAAMSAALGVLIGVVLVVAVIVAIVYLWTMLSFAPVAIVLERLPVLGAIGRSFDLVRGSFWRVFGIRILGMLVAQLVAGAVAVPFTIAGEVLNLGAESVTMALVGSVLLAVGGAIGQIITAPFTAGI
ncbi:MAG TPA: hypothetical protein VFK56_06235, partial [Mycobacterium sp.]|nr:hypothetical protein [Mycobacterium sp.]